MPHHMPLRHVWLALEQGLVYGTIAAEVVAHRWLLLDWSLSPERVYDEPTFSLFGAKGLIKVSGRES
jgi:hypothetical protein